MKAYVLWENHATGPIDKFGPHVFLIACVAARLHRDRFELRRSNVIDGRSCGGDSNLLRLLGFKALWDTAPQLIAVLDSDKIHKKLGGESRGQIGAGQYGLWATRMEARCREHLRAGPYHPAQLTICFLDRNLESLLEVLGDTSSEKWPVRRDQILQRAAADPALIRRALEAMPSWAGLVDAVVTKLSP